MGRFSGGFRAAGAGSTTLPSGSLYAPAGNRLILREVHVFNTTTTEVAVALRELTTTGTQGAAESELAHDDGGPAPTGTLFNTHTVGPTITAGFYATAVLAAAIGGGIVWTFNEGIYIPAGTANGVGVVTATGTGQVVDMTFIWDE